MLDLYVKDSAGFVDLYYNDAVCLNKTFQKSRETIEDIVEDSILRNRMGLERYKEC